MKSLRLMSCALAFLLILGGCTNVREIPTASEMTTDGSAQSESTGICGESRPSTPSDAEKSLPVLSLTTETGEDVDPYDGNEYYISGTLSLSQCEEKYLRTDLSMQIRGRGNYSWTSCPKKSYRIKLDQSDSLLGLGEGKSKSWCLLANYVDQSLMRNLLTFRLARGLSGIDWSPDATSVVLYLNGEYWGIYLLTEAIKVDEHRVNVTVDETEETGFLLQMTHNSDEIYHFDVYGINFDVKSDLSADPETAKRQKNAIQSVVEDCFEAVLSEDEGLIREKIDLDSLIDCYLLEEFNKNLDVGWDSFYLYRDVGGKLTFGPVWDFDLAFGNARSNGASLPYDLYAGVDFGNDIHTNYWFTLLMEQDWFRHAVAERWNEEEVQTLFSSASDIVRAETLAYGDQYAENFEIWALSQDRGPDALRALTSFEEHAAYLANWVDARYRWLCGFIGSDAYFAGEMSDGAEDTVETR
ncbi:MAG: CotH kinase family protein [Eubacteriales bacterium]